MKLPSLSSLSRPSVLFKKQNTSIVTIRMDESAKSLTVQCSREDVLNLIKGYFSSGRLSNDYNISPNCSLFSGIQDSFTLFIAAPRKSDVVNPALVLAFVEGELEYKLVHTNGSSWMYRS
ncbi:hypothetical protein B0H19DRAFT_1113604 [Mycena capillaripes]|nr:hypothetical protein B0H19DRAFT_1113604 [Mycena capillaripes]